jgi:hypothetical protein
MKYGRFRLASALLCIAMLTTGGTLAYGQGATTTSLSGTVSDTSGAVVPGADVNIKNNATGAVFTAVSGANGTFTVPALQPGTYTVTVTLMGFKTWSAPDVTLNVASPAQIRAVLELGKLEETVVVEGAAQIIQTQTSAIASTISTKQITNLPGGRDMFGLMQLMPGVTSSSSSVRYGSVNGLPQSSINITLDGMNIQDNYLKTTDGMFTRVSPRIDAVEEVTVGTAAQGADMAGQGGVQVKFVTRAGTNQYRGSGYYYFQRDWMNTNTWWNTHVNVDATGKPTAKPVVALYQPGGRLGGPILKDKAFFFINYEVARSPGTGNDTNRIMSPLSEQGIFQYGTGQTVDLLALAAKNGQVSTIDPTVARILANIRTAVGQAGTVNPTAGDPLTQDFNFPFPTKGLTKYPTIRLDYNVTTKHRVSASLTQNHLISNPDTLNGYERRFPGFATQGMQDSYRWTSQLTLRSTLGPNMVNEAQLGGTGGSTFFNPELNAGMFSGQTPDMGGYAIGISAFRSITNPYSASANSAREGSTRVIEDRLNWIKGAHSMTMGGSFTQPGVWLFNQQVVGTVAFGIASGDPADSMFTTANFPTANSTDLSNARALYAVLTGRITNVGYNARIGEDGSIFNILGPSMQLGRQRQVGFFWQDSWKMKPSLTLNLGLRYDIQYPFYALNNSYSTSTLNDIFGITGTGTGLVPGDTETNIGNLFKPGTLQGTKTTYQQLTANNYGYNVDYNNLAPSVGVAWKLPELKGFLGKITGQDAVIRAGYNIAYQRGDTSDFTGVYGSNPGISIDDSVNQTNKNLTVPTLLRNGIPSAPAVQPRTYPMAVPNASSSVYTFDPNIQLPYASSAQVGMQRALNKTTAIEVRWVHTTSSGTWRSFNYNETNIVENGFLNEFRLAQQNLVLSGGKSFAYTGAAGSNQLPTLLAYLNGKPASQAGTASAYSGSTWTNSTFLTYLYALNPNPLSFAGSLRTNGTYAGNAITAGLPANFFVVNPDVSGAYVTANGGDTRYNGLQLVLTRRFSGGLQVGANYAFGKGYQQDFYSFRKPWVWNELNYNNSRDNSYGNIRHNFSANWVYELPFGQGKRFGAGVGRNMNRLIGNWSYTGIARVQSGRLLNLGNVRLVGMTAADVQNMLQLRFTTNPSNSFQTVVYDWPQDVIDNTIKAYSLTYNGYSAALGAPTGRYFAPANGPDCIEVASGYGDCGVRTLIVQGPKIMRFDMSLLKDVMVTSRVGIQVQAQVFNVFNRVNFLPVSGIGSSTTSGYQVTGSNDSSRTMQLGFRINF